jgi:hypothetical protein
MPQPRILAPAPPDDDESHAGRIAGRPPHALDTSEDEGIEESGLHFEVVRRVTGYGDKNAVVMDDCRPGWPSDNRSRARMPRHQ